MKKVELSKRMKEVLKKEGIEASQDEAYEIMNKILKCIANIVSKGEKVKTATGIFEKRHKNERQNPERKVVLHGVERTILASTTPAKDVLAFKSKVEYK